MIESLSNAELTELSWSMDDGCRIHARCWTVAGAKAAVLITHGLGDHGGRYENVARILCAGGYSVLIPDLRGHGKSDGQRGYVRRFDELLNDLDRSMTEMRRRFSSLPFFGYGHSFGGLLVLYHALRRKPELVGMIASSPAIRISMHAPAWKIAMARTVGVLLPGISLRTKLDLGELSDDPDHEKKARDDELMHGRITPNTWFGMVAAGKYCLENAAKLTTPTLIMHGGLDTITDPLATQEFASAAPGCDYHEWPEGKHELHHMAFGDDVIRFAARWMAKRLNKT